MTETDSQRLRQIAVEVGDAWLRCRGPLTGVKALVGAKDEAARLGAGPEYLDCFDRIVVAARAIQGGSPARNPRDALRVLEHEIPRLRAAA
jgi:hypothetical protein